MNLLFRNLYRKILQNSYFDNRYQTALNVGMDHFQRCFVTNSTFLKKNINFRKSLIQLHTVKVAPGRNYSPNFNLDFGNVLKDTLKKVLLINSGALKRRGFLWYATIEGVRFNEFFELLELPDVFLSWFKITELHVWMLLVNPTF